MSVVIPSFRQPQFLWRAIESCLEQDHAELEVIVIEDFSRDASLGLALSYAERDSRVRVIECTKNGGLGKARNIGLAHATGDYLCFLDSDDYLLAGSISARVAALPGAITEHGESVVGVYGDWQHVSEAVNYPTVRAPRSVMPLVSAASYTGENVFICSAPLVNRKAVVDAGGFPEGLQMLEDFALWAKMIADGAIFVPVRHVVSTYRQRPNSMLRGDGVVVMADHVAVINEWMAGEGTPLADGGAMSAWLGNATPFSHGRMSWNVPSVLGNFGGSPGATAVDSSDTIDTPPVTRTVPDFMSAPVATGLTESSSMWTDRSENSTTAIIVATLADSLEAIGIAEAQTDPANVGIFSAEPPDWPAHWPLALAGYAVRPLDTLPAQVNVVDLRSATHDFAEQREAHIQDAVAHVWPDTPPQQGSIVYVPDSLDDYPALDAWISVALHALAEAGHEPRVMAEASMRTQLGGYRSELMSIEALRSSSVVVMPTGDHTELINLLTSAVVFHPSSPGSHAKTAGELRRVLRAETGR